MAKVLKLDEGIEPLVVHLDGRQIEVPHPADMEPEVLDRLASLGDFDEDNASFSDELAAEIRDVARAIAPGLPEDISVMRALRFLGWYGNILSEYLEGLSSAPKAEGKSRRSRESLRQ
ncbi:MAG TPA: hypothetical protein ENJ54_04315 [Chloroflexi bacterium]|nr:hypothetical protein [Chloroflexota bacterium]